MDDTKLNTIEAISLILIVIINNLLLNLITSIVSNSKSSSLITSIYLGIIALLIVLLIVKLFSKFKNQDILDISEKVGGKVLKIFTGILFALYFIFVIGILLRNFSNDLQIIYYPMTKIFFIALLLLIFASVASTLKYNSIFKTNVITIPFIVFAVIFLFIANLKNYSFNKVFPILGDGINSTFFSGLSNLFAFSGIAFIYFLPSRLKENSNLKKISIISIIFSTVYLILSIASTIFLFNPNHEINALMPLYSAVRYIEFGTFFQRLDSVFLLIGTISFTCYLSIIIKICSEILNKATINKNPKYFVYPISLLILIISLIPKNNSILTFLETTIYKCLFFIIVIGIALSILIYANLKFRHQNTNRS